MGSNLGDCKRCCGRKRHEQCFCFRCRIFWAHLSWIRNLCLFLFIWISVQFWTSEPICFFFVRSASAVLLFPLCTALPALPGLGPGNRCLQLYLGAEPKGLEPLLLLYVLLLGAEPKGLEPLLLLYVLLGAEPKGLEPLLLLYVLLLLYSSNGSLWQPYERNMGKLWNLAHL